MERQIKKVLGVAGFEPAASCFQTGKPVELPEA